MQNVDNVKVFALMEEFETSYHLIRIGFGELQKRYVDFKVFYFIPLQLLSQGIERFLKSYVCIGYFNEHNELPEFNYIKNLGHNLERIFKTIFDDYYFEFASPQFDIDNDFLNDSEDLNELLRILTIFGSYGRYHNFDLITDKSNMSENPQREWEDFEDSLINSEDYEKLGTQDLSHEVSQKVTAHIICVFEKFLSALSRQFIFKCLGENCWNFTSNNFINFGLMYDNYGETNYRKETTRFKNKPKKKHKRTVLDEIKSRANSKYKSVLVKKSEFDGEWAFYADEVVIENRENHWFVVIIDGYEYALNGSASGRYKLETPHSAGMAIIGKSVSAFIEIAQNLTE